MNHDDHFEEDFPILVLVSDDGEEMEFELLAEIEIDSDIYRVLIPLDYEDEDESEGVVEVEIEIFKVVYDEEGNEFLSDIEDDEEWERVADAWQELMDTHEF